MMARMKEMLVATTAACARIAVAFLALLIVWDAGYRVVAQIAPTHWFFAFDRVVLLPTGKVSMVYRSSRFEDLPIGVVTELIGPDDRQPCAASGKRIIEAESDVAIVPIARMLPGCAWAQLSDGAYRLQVTGSYPAGGAFDKSVTLRSDNAILVEGGRIVGATATPRDPAEG